MKTLQDDGNRFGLQKSIGFTGSGELDNGHTVSLEHYMAATGCFIFNYIDLRYG